MSGFSHLWKSSNPVVTFASLAEAGKGLPIGWVSKHGDQKAQKQSDGTWVYVPHDTPLGMQPVFKGTGQSVSLTHDDEMMSYLKSVGFDDPAKQKALLTNPKWTSDVLKKFGAGFLDKYKKLSATPTNPAIAPSTPAVAPAAPPPPFAASGTPPEQAMKILKVAAGTPEAFAIQNFHQTGDIDATLDAFSKKFSIKYASAYDKIETLLKAGAAKGIWNIAGDMFDGGAKVTFNVGTGPVISAPAIAATTAVPSLTVKQTEPSKQPAPVKAKKPAASTFTPVPTAPAVPAMKGWETPTEPKVIALAAKLGHAADSDTAKILDVWRKRIQKGTPGSFNDTTKTVAAISGWTDHAAHEFLLDLITKVLNTDGWNHASFADDSGALPGQQKPEPAPILTPSTVPPPTPATTPVVGTPPGLEPVPEIPSLALDKAVSDMVAKLGYQMGAPAAVAVGMLSAHNGDVSAAAKGMQAALGWTEPQAFKVAKFVYAKMMALKAGDKAPEAPAAVAKLISPAKRLKGIPPADPVPGQPIPGVLPAIPPIASLTYAGDAKTKLGGNKPKKFVKDESGNLFLHKYGADQLRAAGGEVASRIAAAVSNAGEWVPVKAVEYEGDWGTIQPVVPDVTKDGLSADPSEWTDDDIKQLLRERVIDWVSSNHDSKIGNFIKTKKGQIFGIDKEQAFKFIGNDKLALDYSPNPSAPVYNSLFQAYAAKIINLNPNEMLPFVQSVEKHSDEDWLKLVKPYLDALPESERDEKAKLILARKNSVRTDLETFFSMLKKKRGDAGAFVFPGAPSKPVAEPANAVNPLTAPVVSVGLGVLVAPPVPALSSLTYKSKASIGGAGEKHFYTDEDGKLWLLKVAANKGDKKPEPWKVGAQVFFSTIGKAVKPQTPPVGAAEFKGKPATLQPWLGDNLKTLAGVPPEDLTVAQKKDVATEHVLDWLMSQHDTHGGNLVILPDNGAVVGIDKEQGYKYLLPNPKWTASTPQGDVLSVDYHPNAQYGESEPYYNKFWKAFADGSMYFNPTSMKGAIEAVEKIPEDAFAKALSDYAQALQLGTNANLLTNFYTKALDRKKHIRAEFESFITKLYKKQLGKNGTFTFEAGWVPEGASAPTPLGEPSVPGEPAKAPLKPKSSPQSEPTAYPTGFVPPSQAAFAKAAVALGFSKGSVYYPALKQLQLYNNSADDSAKQLSYLKNLAPDVALKRVKYALKKLKSLGGWTAFTTGPAAVPSAVATPVAALNPASTGASVPSNLFVPGMEGELGNQGVVLVSATDAYKPPPPPPLPPVPEGFSPPPEGKMWEVKKANMFFSADTGGHLYKTKPPKNPDGTKDEGSLNLVAKFKNTTVSAVKEAIGQVGIEPIAPLKEKAPYVVGVFAKTDWSKAQVSDKKIGVLIDLPPPPPPPSGKFTAAPQAGTLKNADASGNMHDLSKLNEDTKLGYGMGFRLGGNAVEHQSVAVQRRLDPVTAKPFFRFTFKLREPFWKKLKGSDTSLSFKIASYNEKNDAFKEQSKSEHDVSVRQWKKGASTASLATNGDGSSYALKGLVVADVKPEGDETPLEAFKKLLKSIDPSVEEMVLHDPTPEEDKVLQLSALLWSVAPQQADALTETQRNVPYLTEKLKAEGYSQAQMDSVHFERVGVDQTVPVLPGRGKALQAKHDLGYVSFCCSSPDRVLMQLRGGSVGIAQRLKHGFTITQSTTSGKSDIASGGADYVFTWPGHKDLQGWENHWGTIEMAYDPSEFDRLDCFMHQGDCYGRTNGEVFNKRTTLEKNAGSAKEICFRQGLNVNKLLKIRCQNEAMVPQLIKMLKDAGITKVNGMTPEELVVSGSGYNESFYKTFLAPGGY